MCKTFDNVAAVPEYTKHNTNLLNTMCTNIRNDIEILNICIKVLRQSMEEGKKIYAKCNLAYLHLYSFENQIKGKIIELQMLTNNFMKQDKKLEKFEHTMEEIHDNI